MPKQGAYQRAVDALGRALISSHPGLTLSPSGAVVAWKLNLLDGIEPALFEAELNDGDGRELDGKFRAAHSSSALAVNNFARFKTAPALLQIAGWSGFETLRFEAKCPIGIRGGRPPNLDLLLTGQSMIVGVESKCTEHLTTHTAEFSPAHDEQITDWRRKTPWFELMKKLDEDSMRYRYLDAAQLVKHAFGLGRTFEGQDVALLYLYWEPSNADAVIELQEHRREVIRFATEVAGAKPSFTAISYRDLWRSWKELRSPEWLPGHLAAIRARYDLAI